MKQLYIGEVIKNQRKRIKMTQEELCCGICDISTLSRIERGTQNPTPAKLNALLGRLNLPTDKYFALLTDNELEMERLKTEIIDCNTRKMYEQGLQKLQRLEEIMEPDDHITQQFILRSKVLAGKIEDGQHSAYSFDEKLDMLYQAIRLTIPNFDIDNIAEHLYSLDELKIVNQIGQNYIQNEMFDHAIDVYYQLMKFIEKKCLIISDNVATIIMIAYNYSNILCRVGRHERALQLAQWGLEKSLEWSRAGSLGGLLSVLGESLYQTGRTEESKTYIQQAYYMYQILGRKSDMELMRQNLNEYFGMDI